ncbi:acyl carrier protein [Streptomyces sp. NPDC056661]|uniref:acyl carrier protein n=1 Tax=Streptomyces sp. NPDC056661 TaxID=3345898 RepID=UPI0036CF1D29
MSEVTQRVRRFITDGLGWDGPMAQLTDELALIDQQVVDSLGILSLVEFLEAEFQIRVEDAEITRSHLGTIAAIEHFVMSKRSRTC